MLNQRDSYMTECLCLFFPSFSLMILHHQFPSSLHLSWKLKQHSERSDPIKLVSLPINQSSIVYPYIPSIRWSVTPINQSNHKIIRESYHQRKIIKKNNVLFSCLFTGPPPPLPLRATLLCPLQLLWHCPSGIHPYVIPLSNLTTTFILPFLFFFFEWSFSFLINFFLLLLLF